MIEKKGNGLKTVAYVLGGLLVAGLVGQGIAVSSYVANHQNYPVNLTPLASQVGNNTKQIAVLQNTTNVILAEVNKIGALTDGYSSYLIEGTNATNAVNAVKTYLANDNNYPLRNELSPIVRIDAKYINVVNMSVADSKVIALTNQDKTNGVYTASVIFKVTYKDVDAVDNSVVYVESVSNIDNGFVYSTSLAEVPRNTVL